MFSWLAPTGVQHGRLLLDLEQRPPSDLEYLALEPSISFDTITPKEVLSMVPAEPSFQAGCHMLFSATTLVRVPSLPLKRDVDAGHDTIPSPAPDSQELASGEPDQWACCPGCSLVYFNTQPTTRVVPQACQRRRGHLHLPHGRFVTKLCHGLPVYTSDACPSYICRSEEVKAVALTHDMFLFASCMLAAAGYHIPGCFDRPGEGLYEVVMDNEERDLWRSFLDREDFPSAARHASTQVCNTHAGCLTRRLSVPCPAMCVYICLRAVQHPIGNEFILM